jgi:hypothetical protein
MCWQEVAMKNPWLLTPLFPPLLAPALFPLEACNLYWLFLEYAEDRDPVGADLVPEPQEECHDHHHEAAVTARRVRTSGR